LPILPSRVYLCGIIRLHDAKLPRTMALESGYLSEKGKPHYPRISLVSLNILLFLSSEREKGKKKPFSRPAVKQHDSR
jgi:hypothetical protein